MFSEHKDSDSSSSSSSIDDSWAPLSRPKQPKRISTASSTVSKTSSRRSSVQRHCETCSCYKKPRKVSDKITTYSLFTKLICSILDKRPELCPELASAATQQQKMAIRGPFISQVWKLVKPNISVDKQGSVLKSESESFYNSLSKITQQVINSYIASKNKKKNRF